MFYYSQSLTECQKQTREVIKISRHAFLKTGVKNTKGYQSRSHAQIRPETNLISEPQ